MPATFLVTTALQEFWDHSAPLLFIDESCRRYSERQAWQSLDGDVLPLRWRKEPRCRRVLPEVVHLANRIVQALGERLNQLHGTRFEHRYWRILLYPWAYPHVSALYDHLRSVEEAFQYDPELTTLVLAEEDFAIARDSLEYFSYLATDLYNLQLYSRTFTALGYRFPTRRTSLTLWDAIQPTFISAPTRRVAESLEAVARALRLVPREVYVLSPYWGLSGLLRLIVGSGGRIWPFVQEPLNLTRKPLHREARARLGDLLDGDSPIERVIRASVPWEIPQCFVESYSELVAAANSRRRLAPRAIVSANGWYYHEVFKEWAARAATRGTLLAGVQHGGQYGMLSCRGSEETHEIAIADRYYSWGWDRADIAGAVVVPMPAPNLWAEGVVPARNDLDGILFTATAQPRFVNCICNTTEKMIEYLEWQMRFLDNLPATLHRKLRARLHRDDAGWDIADRWRDHAPRIEFESWDRPFIESLAHCRLMVCDHCSTTMLQALAANRPTILFWDPAQYRLVREAQPYFNELARAGILLNSPEAAALAVQQAYPDVEAWWNETQRQHARARFCARFARTSPNALVEWRRELLSMSRGDRADATAPTVRGATPGEENLA